MRLSDISYNYLSSYTPLLLPHLKPPISTATTSMYSFMSARMPHQVTDHAVLPTIFLALGGIHYVYTWPVGRVRDSTLGGP